MNSAISHTKLRDFNIPSSKTPQSLKPVSQTDDLDDLDDLEDEIQFFRVLELTDDFPTPALPVKPHPVLDVSYMAISVNHMRRIEYELKHDECDLRTVFTACRGLKRGTVEFEDAYIAARIRSFVKHQRIPTAPLPDNSQPNMDTGPQIPCRTAMKQKLPPPPHPMAVIHLGHLMSHLGIWVIALLATQVWAAWRLSAVADVYLEGGRFFYLAIGIFLMLALDSVVWFRRRGYLFDAFLVPGAVLFLIALLPIFILHVRGILLAMN